LCLAVSIAQVNEDHAAVIARGVDPTAQCNFLTDFDVTQLAAGM